MHNVLQEFRGRACYFCQVWFPAKTMYFLLLDTQWRNGLPTLELALPHTEKEREVVGEKGPLMKGLNPAPRSHSSPPSFPSLPCGVNLAKRRQHQPIYTSSSSFFFSFLCRAFSFGSPCLCLHPHPPLCSLCAYACLPRVCARGVCVVVHASGRWNNIMYSKVKDGPNPWGCQHLPHASCAAEVSWHR